MITWDIENRLLSAKIKAKMEIKLKCLAWCVHGFPIKIFSLLQNFAIHSAISQLSLKA
jgi:hypothetical protein